MPIQVGTDANGNPIYRAKRSLDLRILALEDKVFGSVTPNDSINITSFNGDSPVTLNGSAALNNGAIILTPDIGEQAGSVIFKVKQNLNPATNFSLYFTYQINGDPQGADGIAFFIHSSPLGESYLGDAGGEVGYSAVTEARRRMLAPSVGWQFLTYQGDAITFSYGTEEAVLHSRVDTGIDTGDGAINHAWIDIQAARAIVRLSKSPSKPESWIMNEPIILHSVLGSSAWIGFSSGTGGASNEHVLKSISWSTS